LDKGYNYQKQVDRKCFEILLELFQGESDRWARDVNRLLSQNGLQLFSLLFGNVLWNYIYGCPTLIVFNFSTGSFNEHFFDWAESLEACYLLYSLMKRCSSLFILII
jgi:hypothetical protein